MSFGEAANFTTHHLMDWLEESATFLDNPYSVSNYDWWDQDLDQVHSIHTPSPSTLPMHAELSKKRKLSTNPTPTQHHRQRVDAVKHDDEVEVQRKPGNGRKAQGKGGNKENSSNRDARWAEQLLNPCASAIESANISRVQHLVCVLNELASLSGDANHRLAFHGLRSLTRHLTSPPSFASTEISLFRSSLIKFHEVSPWFAFPNALANASILHAADSAPTRPLHVVDIGVSHGIQWPTLLEALTRRHGGAPDLVRITSAGSAAPAAPFSSAPPGYDFDSHLLRYAKSINLNLRIDRVEELNSVAWSPSGGETLVVCVQFRSLGDAFLETVREMAPELVVMTEMDGGDDGGEGFAEGFARRAGMMWKFLDSTGVAFRGRDCEERRVVEGEAARVLDGEAAAEGRRLWRERMTAAGFREQRFAEESVEAGRALLRKYDGNWEMRASTSAATPMASPPETAVGLRWKGQPVSLCSLWKPLEAPGGP